MNEERKIEFNLNGQTRSITCPDRKSLADALREDCAIKGVRVGCEQGVCGACTVLIEGESVRSCLLLARQASGRGVYTVESLSDGGIPHPLQEAFGECHGLQCGFCTSGILAVAIELINEEQRPSRNRIREAISGNLCRCTGYQNIVDAIEMVVEERQSDPEKL